jgi:hypothetical protein
VLIPLLEMSQRQTGKLCSAKATAEEKRQDRVIPFVPDGFAGRYG